MKEKILDTFKEVYLKAGNLKPEQLKTSKDIVRNFDVQIGKIVTDSLLANKDKKVRIVSEECPSGMQNFTAGKEDYYIVVDDLDGTDNYYRGANFNLPSATSIVIFEKDDSSRKYRFKDIKCAACIDYASGKVWYTEQGLGTVELYQIYEGPVEFKLAFKVACKTPSDMYSKFIQDEVNNMQKDKDTLVQMRIPHVAETKTKVVLTDLNTLDSNVFSELRDEFRLKDFGSSVLQYCMVAARLFDGYVANYKTSHELGILYLMAKENGVKMVDFDNDPYDNKVYDFSERYDIIAGNAKVVDEIYNFIK